MAQSEESITLMTPYGILSIYLLTVADPSRSFRMTFNIPCHYDALPYPVIQSGSKNAV